MKKNEPLKDYIKSNLLTVGIGSRARKHSFCDIKI